MQFLPCSFFYRNGKELGAFEYYGGSNVTSAGDVNGSGEVDIIDALLIAQYYVGLNPANFHPENADVNCDGSINIIDALVIAQYYIGLITEFC
ncbi:MAG: dockerin type I repeat-containing protein [Spirochaetales bacterium]|nr:dockerin type I repeat-containing protein [Spirochaetales bacterium]